MLTTERKVKVTESLEIAKKSIASTLQFMKVHEETMGEMSDTMKEDYQFFLRQYEDVCDAIKIVDALEVQGELRRPEGIPEEQIDF